MAKKTLMEKIDFLSKICNGHLSFMQTGKEKWTVHNYEGGTPMGGAWFEGQTLEGCIDFTLRRMMEDV